MRTTHPVTLWTVGLLLATAPCAAGSPAPPDAAPAALVVAWNEQVLAVAEAEDRFLTLKGLRTAAMMQLAIHDALNAIQPRFATWLAPPPASGADPAAAAARAAFEVARDQYPDQEARFRVELERWLAAVAEGPAKAAGTALGSATAAAILAERASDGWGREAKYRWQPMAPGVYAEFRDHSGTPEGFVFGAGWAAARPFALARPSQFRSPPPPPVDGEAYARAFEEVKKLGAADSVSRTAEQSHLAMWWKEFVESSHNRLARRLVVEEGLDAWAAARLFALLEVSLYDAYVGVFENKFHYNHWRPYTAIRRAAHDGNPSTREDPDWDNLHHHTYAFPSYPSAHGAVCAAAATVLADTFGSDRPVTMVTERVDRSGPLSEKIRLEPAARSFASFAAAAEECALSRVYLGIHFRYDAVAGTELGRRIASHVLASFLRPRADRGESFR
jgi:membrane-associated phospholipid phosphatase